MTTHLLGKMEFLDTYYPIPSYAANYPVRLAELGRHAATVWECETLNGVREGLCAIYHHGTLVATGNFLYDKPHGRWSLCNFGDGFSQYWKCNVYYQQGVEVDFVNQSMLDDRAGLEWQQIN